MRGTGVILGILFLLILCQMPIHAEAGRTGRTPTWNNGLSIKVEVENNDFWTTNVVSEIYFILTLVDTGAIIDFHSLIFDVTVVTEVNYTGRYTIVDPWDNVGDKLWIVGQFNLTNADVNNAGWDTYMTSFYYNFSVMADTDDRTDVRFYTWVYEGTPLTISTFGFIVYWPFPPIILMAVVYWTLYFGLKRFNKRYEGLDKDKDKSVETESNPPDSEPTTS